MKKLILILGVYAALCSAHAHEEFELKDRGPSKRHRESLDGGKNQSDKGNREGRKSLNMRGRRNNSTSLGRHWVRTGPAGYYSVPWPDQFLPSAMSVPLDAFEFEREQE